MARDRSRGTMRNSYALDPFLMARACRKMAADLRVEAARGYPPIMLATGPGGGGVMEGGSISRADAAASMDEQAARWELEAQGGPRNIHDRIKIGLE